MKTTVTESQISEADIWAALDELTPDRNSGVPECAITAIEYADRYKLTTTRAALYRLDAMVRAGKLECGFDRARSKSKFYWIPGAR